MRAALLAVLLLAGMSVAQAQPEPMAAISFDFVDGFILIEAHVSQSKRPLTMLLDSGAGVSVVSLRTARQLQLKLGAPENVRGVGADAVAYHIDPLTASAQDIPLASVPLAVDLHNAAQICSHPVDGIIGINFFEGRIVQIDYAARCIRLLSHAEAAAGTSTLSIRVLNHVMSVPVSVNDSAPRWTRVDTGCNDELHWVIPRANEPQRARGVSIGFLTDTNDTALSSVRLGDRFLPGVETCLHGQPIFPGESGLLGNGVLSAFIVTFDNVNHRMILQGAAK